MLNEKSNMVQWQDKSSPTMWTTKLVAVVALTCLMSGLVDSSQTVMKSMTKNFLQAYEACAKEYGLTEATGAELMSFWKEGFQVTSRLAGCAIYCLTSKLDLLDPEGKLHHGNTAEFAKAHGSDEAMANKVVELLHACEKSAAPTDDQCLMALDVAMCFKNEIHKLGWAPDSELLFDEMVNEYRQG